MSKKIIISNFTRNKIFVAIALLIVFSVTASAQTSEACNDRDTVIISNFQEFLVDTAIFNVIDYGEQIDPTLAFDGTNYLVAWSDYRKYKLDSIVKGVYGSLVNSSGVVTGGTGFIIYLDILSWTVNSIYKPSISFGGNNYLLSSFFCYDMIGQVIQYSRIDRSGNLIDTPGIHLDICSNDGCGLGDPKVIFNGSKYFNTWIADYTHGGCITGKFIDTSGIADTSNVMIDGWIGGQHHDNSQELAFDGTNYLIVWERVTGWPPKQFRLYGIRVSSSGSLIDTNAFQITSGENEQSPSISFDGTNYLVVWEQVKHNADNRDIYGVRVSPAGVILDQNPIPISTSQYDKRNPAIIYDGNNYIVVWQDNRSGSTYDIYGTMVSENGEVENPFPVSVNPGDQVTPALTKGPGNQILVVYSGWAGTYNGITYNSMRIWGAKMDIFVGIENNKSNMAKTYSLCQNYPNPFNPATKIKYQIPKQGFVTLKVYDVLGKELTTLVNEKQNAGSYIVNWNAINYPSGVYFYRLTVGDYTASKKMILIK